MIVVSNTSPLTNLAAIGQFELLRYLYHEIHIPDGVWHELNAYGQVWPGSAEVANASWIDRHQVTNHSLVVALRRDLDRGEAETIALAVEMKAELVLMDEKDGRRLAQRHGLRVTGILGILLDAKQSQLIDAVLPQVDALRQTAGFYLSERVYQGIGKLANE